MEKKNLWSSLFLNISFNCLESGNLGYPIALFPHMGIWLNHLKIAFHALKDNNNVLKLSEVKKTFSFSSLKVFLYLQNYCTVPYLWCSSSSPTTFYLSSADTPWGDAWTVIKIPTIQNFHQRRTPPARPAKNKYCYRFSPFFPLFFHIKHISFKFIPYL